MFNLIFNSSVSACFELENTNPYYSPKAYKVLLNGKPAGEFTTNVFSLFNLQPATLYTVTIDDCDLTFKTDSETGVVDVKALGAKADGVSDDTYYVQMAIDSCPKGGRVLFTEGSYYVRPVVLRSNITIELKAGAQLLGDVVEEHYPYVPREIFRRGRRNRFGFVGGQPLRLPSELRFGV